jgi:hypothetical protein
MKTFAIKMAAVVASGLLTPVAMLAADGNFDKTLTVSGTPVLSVTTGSGFIHIVPGEDGQIHVIGHVHSSHGWMGGGSDEDVRHVVNNPPIEQTGSTIRIGNNHDDNSYRHVSIDYEITAPRTSQVKAFTGSGDIKASGVLATKLETGSGEIEANNLSGDISLQTGSGDIKVEFAKSGMVTAGTGSGSIHLQNVQGGLKAETGSGDIKITGQPSESWKLETGSGSIDMEVGSARMTLDAESGSGSITTAQGIVMQGSLNKHHVTGNINGGGPTVKAETGSGDIKVH